MAKILIIDDEEIIRKRMKNLLELDYFEVCVAENGFQGIEVFKKEKPDIVCVDVKMPGMDGIEVLKRIKKISTSTEVIVITGHGGLDTAIQAMREGAFCYIQKPLDYDILQLDLAKALERQEMRKQLDLHVNNLEQMVKERTIQLNKANEELQNTLKEKSYALDRLSELNDVLTTQKEKLETYNRQLQRDHIIAEEVFKNVRQANFFESPNIKFMLSPMSIFNGDVLTAAKSPSGTHYIMLGDFTGHGLSAAICAIPVSDIFYEMTAKGFFIAEIAAAINLKLKSILPTGLFFAVCIMELDAINGILKAWNGGIPDALILSKEGGIKKHIPSQHLPLGITDNSSLDMSVAIIKVDHGDRIYIYSDGLIESMNVDNEMFGPKGIEKCINETKNPSALFYEIKNSLNEFSKGKEQNDDITLIEIICDPLPYIDSTCSKPVRKKMLNYPVNLRMTMQFSHEILPKVDVLPLVNDMLSQVPGLADNNGNILTIFSELYNNALDHGLLKLDSSLKKTPEGFVQYFETREKALNHLVQGWIKVDFEHTPLEKGGQLTISVQDSGLGFNSYDIPEVSPENINFYGRGILLVRSLCKSLIYQGRGNIAQAVYVWE